MRIKKKQSIFSTRNIVSLFFVLLMATSILAIWQGGSSDVNTLQSYNGFDIIIDGSTYLIETPLGDVHGYTYPEYIESIELDEWQLAAIQQSSHITILFDPTDNYISYIDVLRSHLASRDLASLGKTISFAMTEENNAYPYKQLNCSSAPEGTLYLHTMPETTTHIFIDNNCLVLEGATGQDLVYAKDRFVYSLYGIMK